MTFATGLVPLRAQMPDPRLMAGRPLPVGDLAPGTVTVRVVRGSMTNVVPGQAVELSGGGTTTTAKTDASGRAEFSGLRPGTLVKATTVVDGERLESLEFAVPVTGGIRVALIAGLSAAAPQPAQNPQATQAPAQPGTVTLGDRTRFVFEMGDEALNAFAILEVLNSSAVPVQPGQPLALELPAESQGAGILEGSSPQGTIEGKRVLIAGPFAPGSTLVQFGYSLPFKRGTLHVEQKLPVALAQLSVLAQKVGDMQLESPQIAEHRDMPLQDMTFIVAKGPGLKAGDTLSLTFTGLPHHPVWPQNLALTLAMLILAGGVWGSVRTGKPAAAERERRSRLEARRDRLFSELTAIEEQHRAQAIDQALRRAPAGARRGARARIRRDGRGSGSVAPMAPRGSSADFTSLRFADVSRHFGRRRVLNKVSFQCQAGEILALLGPNGAGKSTLLSIAATLLDPSSGEVRYGDHRARTAGATLRGRIGTLGHDLYLYPELTAAENLLFFGSIYRVADVERRVTAALERAGLAGRDDAVAGILPRHAPAARPRARAAARAAPRPP